MKECQYHCLNGCVPQKVAKLLNFVPSYIQNRLDVLPPSEILPSFSLLEKLSQGSLDALKVAKKFLEEERISKDCMVLFDEMYIHIGADEDGNFFKGVVCFMVVGLKRSVPIVVKAVAETNVSGNFIAENLMDIISKLARIGTVCDDHSSNVNAYSKLSKSYGKDGTYFIHHPSYEGMLKTYFSQQFIVQKETSLSNIWIQ